MPWTWCHSQVPNHRLVQCWEFVRCQSDLAWWPYKERQGAILLFNEKGFCPSLGHFIVATRATGSTLSATLEPWAPYSFAQLHLSQPLYAKLWHFLVLTPEVTATALCSPKYSRIQPCIAPYTAVYSVVATPSSGVVKLRSALLFCLPHIQWHVAAGNKHWHHWPLSPPIFYDRSETVAACALGFPAASHSRPPVWIGK